MTLWTESCFPVTIPEGSQYVPTLGNVIDAPDSQMVSPGIGKLSLIWTAKGSTENSFQSTASSTTPPTLDFGGLRYYIPAAPSGGTTGNKFFVVVKAIVDFRGRE